MLTLRESILVSRIGRRFVLTAVALVVAFGLTIALAWLTLWPSRQRHPAQHAPATPATQPSVTAPGRSTLTLSQEASAQVSADLGSLAAQPVITAATSARYPAIPDRFKGHPDLYARAFAEELLAQDYRRPRS